MLIASNKSLAEYNLAKEPSYKSTRDLLSKTFNEVDELRKKVEKKKDKLDENSRQTSMDITLALLQTAFAEAEEESENIASTFLSQEMSLNDFLLQFIEKKKLYHLRRIKSEKLMEFLRNNPSNQSMEHPPMPPLPSSSTTSSSPSSSSSVLPYNLPPYPILPSAMPNPESAKFPFSRPIYR